MWVLNWKKNKKTFKLFCWKVWNPCYQKNFFSNEPSSSEYRLSGSAALMLVFQVTKMYICFCFCFYRKFFVTGSKTASWRRFLWCFSKIEACFQFVGENDYSCFLNNKLGYNYSLSMIQDRSWVMLCMKRIDPFPEWMDWFLWCTIILDCWFWSRSFQRNAP